MNGIFTANVVATSSPIPLKQAMGASEGDEVIFSIKNHELISFSHVFESGTWAQGPSKLSKPTIKIEFLDTLRIYDPRIISNTNFKLIYFYYGIGDEEKQWTGPIVAMIDPSKITYNTFSNGQRTFILEFTTLILQDILPADVQKQLSHSHRLYPIYKFTPSLAGGAAEELGDLHQTIEKMFVDLAKNTMNPDASVLPLLPNMKKILKSRIPILKTAAKNGTPEKDYKDKKYTSSELANLYKSFFDSLGFTTVLQDTNAQGDTLVAGQGGDGTAPTNPQAGTSRAGNNGPDGRQGIEEASKQSKSSTLQLSIYFQLTNGKTFTDVVKEFFDKLVLFYDTPGGYHVSVHGNKEFTDLFSGISKKSTIIDSNKPLIVIGDENLVRAFIFGGSGEQQNSTLAKNLSDEDKNIYSSSFLKKMKNKLEIDVEDSIFYDPDSEGIVFKAGKGDSNVLDFNFNVQPYMFYLFSNLWQSVADSHNTAKTLTSNSTDDLLKYSKNFTAVSNAFFALLQTLFGSVLGQASSNKLKSFFNLINQKIESGKNPWNKLLVVQVPWFMSLNKDSAIKFIDTKIHSLAYDGTIKTVPFFKFNSPYALQNGFTFVFNDPVYTAGEESSGIGKVFTGKYLCKGFRHTITSDGAFSEFTVFRLPQSGENPILK
jgi:hypothetical protein